MIQENDNAGRKNRLAGEPKKPPDDFASLRNPANLAIQLMAEKNSWLAAAVFGGKEVYGQVSYGGADVFVVAQGP